MPYANLSDGPIYYERPGLNVTGKWPVIFFNGWCLSAQYWEEAAHHLENDWSLLLFDGRGFGRSTQPHYPTTIEGSAIEAEALLAHLELKAGLRYHVVGHSLGGVTAAQFAARAEASGQLASLTIINSGSFEVTDRQGSSLNFFINLFVRSKQWFDSPLLRRSVIARSTNLPISQGYSRVITRDFAEANRQAALELARSSLAMATLKNYRRQLEKLKAPLLLLVGDKDATIPPAGMYNIKRFKPESQLVAFADCGHLPMLERPERFAQSLADHFRQAEVLYQGSQGVFNESSG